MQRKTFLVASLVSYALSLALPAIVQEGGGELYGYHVLAVGMLGLIFLVGFPWIANLFYVFAFIESRGKGRGTLSPVILSSLALVLGLCSFTFKAIPYDSGSMPVDHFGIGFYFWIVAFLLQLGYTLVTRSERSSELAAEDGSDARLHEGASATTPPGASKASSTKSI